VLLLDDEAAVRGVLTTLGLKIRGSSAENGTGPLTIYDEQKRRNSTLVFTTFGMRI